MQRFGSAIPEQQAIADPKFVALGVSAEIVVVLEDQDARRRAVGFAVEPRRGQSADAAADHDQIVILLDRQAGDIEGFALAADLMGDLEGSGMAAAQAGERRRIVAGRIGAHLGERRQAAGDRRARCR